MCTIKFRLHLLAIFTLILGMMACNKDDATLSGISRLFMPGDLSSSVKYNSITVSWGKSYGAVQYVVDLSKDETFAVVDASQKTDSTTLVATFSDLDELTTYYIRVQAMDADPGKNSKYTYGSAKTQALRSIFDIPKYENIGFDFVKLHWQEEDLIADRIVFTVDGEAQTTYMLTPEDMENSSALSSSLVSGTTYRAYMQQGDSRISYIDFSTPVRPEIAIEVDNTADLKTVIESAADGATILLAGGQTYYYSDVEIDLVKNITIQGMPGSTRPLIYLKQFNAGGKSDNTDLTLNEIGLIHLEISGYALDSPQGEPALMTAPASTMFYFYAPGSASNRSVTLGKLHIDDCILRNYARSCIGVSEVSLSNTAKIRIGEIHVENVIGTDLGRGDAGIQSFIALTCSTSGNLHCDKYRIENSTFSYFRHGLIEARKTSAMTDISNPTVEIVNCTFDRMGITRPESEIYIGTNTGRRYFIDFDKHDNAVISVEGCVWGEVYADDSGKTLRTQFTKASISFVNTYASSAVDKPFKTNFVSASMQVSDSPAEMFPGRDQGDYTIPSDKPYAPYGDPRWK